jgi:hypothetical protein
MPRVLLALPGLAAALVAVGCGGSSHSHATTGGSPRASAKRSTTSSSTASATTSATAGSASAGSTASAAAASRVPSSYVAVSRTKSSPGVTVFSTASGHPMRRLTDGDRDIDPMLAQDGHTVFYVHVPTKVCPVQLDRVSAHGGRSRRLTTAGFPGGPVGVSPDGRMLAYTGTTPGTCRLTHPNNWLVLRNLQTGQVHRIHFLVWGVAWAPGDHTLAVVVPDPKNGHGEVRLIANPFRATPAQLRDAPSIPCPDSRPCAETSPSFDAAGTPSFTAMISPQGDRCWLAHCTGWIYALVTRRGDRSEVAISQRLRTDAVLPQSVVSSDGRSFLYTLPYGAGARIWRWSSGGARPIAQPGGTAIQAVWH